MEIPWVKGTFLIWDLTKKKKKKSQLFAMTRIGKILRLKVLLSKEETKVKPA